MKMECEVFRRRKFSHNLSQLFFEFSVYIDLNALEKELNRQAELVYRDKCDIDLPFGREPESGETP